MGYHMGMRLKEMRAFKGFTEQQVDQYLEESDGFIQKFEQDEEVLSILHLRKLALLYEVSSDYLLGLENKRKIFLSDQLTPDQILVLKKSIGMICEEFYKMNSEIL